MTPTSPSIVAARGRSRRPWTRGDRAAAALDLAGLEAEPADTAYADVSPVGIAAAKSAGVGLAIAVARGAASPEEQRRGGADMIVADLQELIRRG